MGVAMGTPSSPAGSLIIRMLLPLRWEFVLRMGALAALDGGLWGDP